MKYIELSLLYSNDNNQDDDSKLTLTDKMKSSKYSFEDTLILTSSIIGVNRSSETGFSTIRFIDGSSVNCAESYENVKKLLKDGLDLPIALTPNNQNTNNDSEG